MNNETEIIREANDRFRRGDQSVPGRMLITEGIQAVLNETGSDPSVIVGIVHAFDTFTEDNDPYVLRDFGAFDFQGHRCFWKIDLDPAP